MVMGGKSIIEGTRIRMWLVSRCEILKWQIPGLADPVNADTFQFAKI